MPKTFELTGHLGQWQALIYWPKPGFTGPNNWHNTMSSKFPHASRANGRALFTGPIGNWLANGVGPVLISQTGIWSASIIFLHRFRWWLVAGAYCMAVPSYYLKQSWFIVDWNLGIQRSENLSEIEVSLSIMHCKYARIIRLNALKISTVECRYNVFQYCKISHKWLQELRQNINHKP